MAVFSAFVGLGSLPANSATPSPIEDPDSFYLFLLIGESNMSGRGVVSKDDRRPHPRIWELNRNHEWELAADPLHFDDPARKGTGMGMAFARTLAESDPKIHVGLIPCAVGGTSIDRWRKGDGVYSNAVHRTRLATKRGRLRGILWHHGEADCQASAPIEWYFPKLTRLFADLRHDLGAELIPIVAGQLSRDWTAERAVGKEFNIRLLRYAASAVTPYLAVTLSDGITVKEDKVHFDSPGLKELGKRYAGAWREFDRLATTSSPNDRKETIRLKGRPVSMIVSRLAARAGVRVLVEREVVLSPEWSETFDAEFSSVAPLRALKAVVARKGFVFSAETEPGLYRLSKRVARP